MSSYQSADLLVLFNRYAGRATADALDVTTKYSLLADAQDEVILELEACGAAKFLIGAPTAMTTSDGGFTWTFGTDGDGNPTFPLGTAAVYPTLNAVPDYPWQPGRDYLDEGKQIRMPNNLAWSGTLYWYGITKPQRMSVSVQPVLYPVTGRILIAIKAVQNYAEEAIRNPGLADEMQAKWDRRWPVVVTAIKRHFRGGRQLGSLTQPFGPRIGGGMGLGSW